MEQYISKAALVSEINKLIAELVEEGEGTMFEQGRISAFEDAKLFLDTLEVKEIGVDLGDPKGDKSAKQIIDTKTLEVKEVNVVPATVMVNKYGNRFISSWPGLKEYDDLKEGQEIKILIPKK